MAGAANPPFAFDCTVDATEIAKLPPRRRVLPNDDNLIREQARILQSQQKWFPLGGGPAYLSQVVPYVYGKCAFADFADALWTAREPEHRIYILGWEGHKDAPLNSGQPGTLGEYLSTTKAEVRAMLWKSPTGPPNSVDLVDLINGLPRG